MYDVLVKNGRIVTADSVSEGNIAIRDGKIAAVLNAGEEPEAAKVIDAKGYISIVKIPIFEYDYYKEFSDQTYFYILRIKRIGDPCAFKMEKKPLPRLCSLWTKNGCKLCFEDRPTGAKHLVPRENMRCLQLYSLEKCICDWKPYTKTLKALYRYYKRRAFFDVLRKKAN